MSQSNTYERSNAVSRQLRCPKQEKVKELTDQELEAIVGGGKGGGGGGGASVRIFQRINIFNIFRRRP